MKDFLEQYKARLTVRGPVFVGSGKEFSKKEYIFLPDRRVGILDIHRVYRLMQEKRRIRPFEEFMMGSYSDLGRWLEREGLREEVAKTCLAYSLDSGDTALAKGQRTQIMSCMKDPLGNPEAYWQQRNCWTMPHCVRKRGKKWNRSFLPREEENNAFPARPPSWKGKSIEP